MAYVKLENLENAGHVGLSLATIFDVVADEYNRRMGQGLPRAAVTVSTATNVVAHPTLQEHQKTMAELDRYFHGFPQDVDGLKALFVQGRALDMDCVAGPTTKRYIVAQLAINTVLQERGIDLTVY